MAHLRINCGSCGGTWAVYDNWNFHDRLFRTCPNCFEEIDEQTWENQVLSALNQTGDANRELLKDHLSGYDKPLFRFDVITDFNKI